MFAALAELRDGGRVDLWRMLGGVEASNIAEVDDGGRIVEENLLGQMLARLLLSLPISVTLCI
jgi:hypothetical protein